jgi:hypothetical protein
LILHPGGLVGWPPGVPSVVYDVAWWRGLVVVTGLAAALCEARGRRRAALGFGLLLAWLGVAFWVAALARPYGVLSDPGLTRWAGDVAVAGGSGGDDGLVVGEPSTAGRWVVLAHRVRPDLVLLIPTLLPLLLMPAAAAVIALAWRRPERTLAALLWIAGSTGGLDVNRGIGFLPGLWARPGPSILWVAVLAVVLSAGRLRRGAALGMALVLAWATLGRRWPGIGAADAILAVTLDQHLWLVAGALGLWRTRDQAALALAAGGALLALSRGLGGPGDIWAGAAFVRGGLVLGTALWVESVRPRLAAEIGEKAAAKLTRWRVSPDRVPSALLLAVLLPGSFLTWWTPNLLDPLAKASLEPVPEALEEAMGWIRENTPPEAVILADPDYAPAIAVIGERRVLRAPDVVRAGDDERRLRLERAVFAGAPPAPLRQRYGLRYVFLAPGQFQAYGVEQPEDLARTGAVRLVYANGKGMHLYEIASPSGRAESFK